MALKKEVCRMNHKKINPLLAVIRMVLIASAASASAALSEDQVPESDAQHKQLAEMVEKQSAEIKTLKTELAERDQTIATLQQKLRQRGEDPASVTNAVTPPTTPEITIQKPFDKITVSQEESKAFQATYIQLFSTRINEIESLNLEFLFKKHGSKVAREDHFDPFSANRSKQNYKTEIRYEFEDPRCLVTCRLIKRILEERYGLEDIPIIHESQYAYKGNRRYIEVYICEELTGQTAEFRDQKLPRRFW